MSTLETLSDDEFIAAFLACGLPPSAFDHLGHLRMAWILLQRLPLEDAVEAACQGIERFAAHLAVPDKYHRTLSEALARLMAYHGGADPARSWPDFVAANPALVRDARGLLERHYSPGLMASAEARRRFLDPDRMPLPK